MYRLNIPEESKSGNQIHFKVVHKNKLNFNMAIFWTNFTDHLKSNDYKYTVILVQLMDVNDVKN
jgi:hypothetical protein